MTTINSTSKLSKGMTLTGTTLSGDTYGMRQYIKEYWGGKWDADRKVWTVNVDKVIETIVNQTWGFCRTLSLSNEPFPTPVAIKSTVSRNGTYCHKCQTWYDDCECGA